MPDPLPSRVPLSEACRQRIDTLFSREHRAMVEQILVDKCGHELTGFKDQSPEELDRWRFAVLRLSEGNQDKLHAAIELAYLDWRDLLMAAGFGHNIHAHLDWQPGGDTD